MKKLIIGATGSIGSAVSRNIQKNGGKTHLVGRNENELTSLAKELGSTFTVADVLNENSDADLSDVRIPHMALPLDRQRFSVSFLRSVFLRSRERF